MAPLEIKELTPELWPSFEALFGKNGACGGCWCMHWRLEKGEQWDQVKGATAKKRMKALVTQGRARGALAGAKIPAAFAWTGTRAMFAACGFQLVGDPAASKQRVRRMP